LLARLEKEAAGMTAFPAGVTDPAGRKSAETFLHRLVSFRPLLASEMPVALGLTLGFNGLDGD
jgi:predicted lipoprotein